MITLELGGGDKWGDLAVFSKWYAEASLKGWVRHGLDMFIKPLILKFY